MGRTLLMSAALSLALVVTVGARPDDKDASKLVGTWKVTSAEKDGKAQTSTEVKGKEVRITKDTITCSKDGKTDMACTYTLDTSSRPWRITMKCNEGEYKGKTLAGIARLEGDTLTVCHSRPDAQAPRDFKTGAGQCCLTLERVKR